jgi:hypothetical protein
MRYYFKKNKHINQIKYSNKIKTIKLKKKKILDAFLKKRENIKNNIKQIKSNKNR